MAFLRSVWPSFFTSAKETQDRELVRTGLLAAQYAVLLVSLYQLILNRDLVSAVIVLGMATYVEKVGAYVVEKAAPSIARVWSSTPFNAEMAQHIRNNYSQVTQISNLFNPVGEKVAGIVWADWSSVKLKK